MTRAVDTICYYETPEGMFACHDLDGTVMLTLPSWDHSRRPKPWHELTDDEKRKAFDIMRQAATATENQLRRERRQHERDLDLLAGKITEMRDGGDW